ncbi:MAG: dipeptide epimerase [Calditrichota bacterium]
MSQTATTITNVQVRVEHLELTRPYTIAYKTVESVENVFVQIETANGTCGIGAGSPAPYVTGEDNAACSAAAEKLEDLLKGKDLRHINSIGRVLEKNLANTPAARAAADIAMYDALAIHYDLPLVEMLGRAHTKIPTSITIGIKSIEESIEEAKEYLGRGFKILKLKIGKDVDQDVEMMHRLRETVAEKMAIRVDANQGYTAKQLDEFAARTAELNVELIEQPVKKEEPFEMLEAGEGVRKISAADESIQTPSDALKLAANPQPFGIYNIKLMKCGGVGPGREIADIAYRAGIDLMWGCMDESIVSITAALHAALASPATRYLDLDGSLDLARDLVKGGFQLKDGYLSTNNLPGLGVTLL